MAMAGTRSWILAAAAAADGGSSVVAFSFFLCFLCFCFSKLWAQRKRSGSDFHNLRCSWTELEVQKCRIEQSGQVAASKSAMAGC
jgi:hypothetical protein